MMWLLVLSGLVIPAVLAQEACYQKGKDMWGGDLKRYVTKSKKIEECLQSCSRYPGCLAFAFTPHDGQCWLKGEKHRDPSKNSYVTSGLMECFNAASDQEPASDFVNVARFDGVKTEQTGSKWGMSSSRAVDGNVNTHMELGGCAHTWANELNEWAVTLDRVYQIDHILIYGVTGDAAASINGARLLLAGQICQIISGMEVASSDPYKFDCDGDATRRVAKVISLQAWGSKMGLCEVQVMVRKSDSEGDAAPATADPGDSDGILTVSGTSCPASHPFVFNNGGYCCKHNKEKVYAPDGDKCDGSSIDRDSTCCLNNGYVVCPVKPCENLNAPPDYYYNVAYGKTATQSSTHSSAGPEKAVDGWTNQVWRGKAGTCTHTLNRANPEFLKVELGRNYKIDHIRVWTREDSTSNRVEGALLWVGGNICGALSDVKKNGPEIVRCDERISVGHMVAITKPSEYLSICELQVMVKKEYIDLEPASVTWPGTMKGGFTNVAVHGAFAEGNSTASQSSTNAGGDAERGNDGNTDGTFYKKSTTHTHSYGHQWWKVDLGRVYKVHHVDVYGRTDCCQDRLNGARVIVGRRIIGTWKTISRNEPQKMTFDVSEDEIYGRWVMVEGVNKIISLAELEVWVANDDVAGEEPPTTVPSLENVAIGRPTTQSTDYSSYVSSKAVDNFPELLAQNSGSCSHTLKEQLNFWQVDLQGSYYIDSITVLGRNDGDAAKRLRGATLVVDGRTIGGLSAETNVGGDHFTYKFPLGGFKGQVVRINRMNEFLSLCEVQVWVNHEFEPTEAELEPINRQAKNIATLDTTIATASSSLFGAGPELAVDEKVNADFFAGTCYFAGPYQNENWLKLEFPRPTTITTVSVYPRLDNYAKTCIDRAQVRVGDTLCGEIVYDPAKLYYDIPCAAGVQGKQVTISKLGWLSICEVVVNGPANKKKKKNQEE